MVSNDGFFTGQKPAAVLKHAVFTAYAHVFFSMLGSRHHGPMWLVDTNAGPGKYEADATGEQVNGSPIVALELAQTQREFATPREVHCAFVEAKKAYVEELKANVAPFVAQGLRAEVLHGNVADQLAEVWDMVGDNPVLTFIDPFGVAAVSKDQMTGTLLDPTRKASSEVLVNINIEAISRHGGYLQWGEHHEPELKPSVTTEAGVELSDAFFGGSWWRRKFLEGRDRTNDANQAAMEVVDAYREIIHAETGASSLVVPIRRTPTGPMLFHFTLFYRHPAAAYKFADAAAKGTAKWREVFRQKDLEELLAREEAQPSLFGAEDILEYNERDAKAREAELKNDAVVHIEANLTRMAARVASGQGIPIGGNIETILGSFMSLAGQSALLSAWDNLAAAGVVHTRDKSDSKNTWKQHVVKQ
ncbi:three-Cys-motif partner protein TcmP [Nocardioides carbamazepini]|uniref:three-Cys-motif partner protein TcmP n=1 Tax=Nocardioides carbamazepini TaxID=2854259 RepID=UPI002149CCA1|nr:three-Cys-motif partner protein TcmP [Nocardioides carbamazepini]MCR1786708.1 three-Cys-motif partner protein TcmP [Nocardioides carbamazepini]